MSNAPVPPSAARLQRAAALAFLLTFFGPLAHAETYFGDVTRFSPDEGQPIFPAGNINVFKQFVLAIDESQRIGRRTTIDLLFTSISFGGELAGGVNAAIGLEVGLCFGGNADFDLGFRPAITVPERFPTEFPIILTVSEGLMPDSHFTTTFPPLGKAYADLIFDLGAYLKATACVFGCVEGINFSFETCDLPIFAESLRCDPALDAEVYCAIELASFNRRDDNAFRLLNVAAQADPSKGYLTDGQAFLAEPYKEYALSLGTGSQKTFFADSDRNVIQVSGVHRFADGTAVTVASSGTLPGGLVSRKTYYVAELEANGLGGIEFGLARREGGDGIDLTSMGSGSHTVTLSETNQPDAPSIGKYGTISITAPTVGTDSRVSAIDDTLKPFFVDAVQDTLVITTLRGFRNGNKVRVSSVGELPDGLARGCVYYVVNAQANGTIVQLATRPGGSPVDITSGGLLTHQIRLSPEFNSLSGLKSTGAEDIMAIGIDVAALISDLIFPPTFPALSDSGSVGPVDWDYTLASLELGPALQLQTDFELTWDLVVTEIYFREEGSPFAKNVKLAGQEVSTLSAAGLSGAVHLTNTGAHALPAIVLMDTEVVDVRIEYTLAPRLKTVVSTPFLGRVKYAALGAGAAISRVGELRFGPLLQGEHNFKVGEFKVYDGDPFAIDSAGPRTDFNLPQDLARYDLCLIDTATEAVPENGCAEVIIYRSGSTLFIRIFDVSGERVADELAANLLPPAMFAELADQLDPWPISSLTQNEKEAVLESATALTGLAPGVITFPLQAAGPPTFFWRPEQVPSNDFWEYGGVFGVDGSGPENSGNPVTTNWLEIISIPPSMLSFPGEYGNGSDVTIDQSPFPTLYSEYAIGALTIESGRRLDMVALGGSSPPAGLRITNGVVDNNGTIRMTAGPGPAGATGYLRFDAPDALLSGAGTLELSGGAAILGPLDLESPFTFTNQGTIAGSGTVLVLDDYTDTTITNLGVFRARSGGFGEIYTRADRIINAGVMEAEPNQALTLVSARFENRSGARLSAIGNGASGYLSFDELENAGLFLVAGGAYFSMAPANLDRGTWDAGQSFAADTGTFRITGTGSTLVLDFVDLTGGRIEVDGGGNLEVNEGSFAGSTFDIGTFNPDAIDFASGSLILFSADTTTFTGVNLNNYGTINVASSVEFIDTTLFANNGKIDVFPGSVLQIHETIADLTDPNASAEARRFPGTANATSEALVGGTWDISGTLLIDGAAFTQLAANAARARTTFGSLSDADDAVSNIAPEEGRDRVLSLGNPAHVILRGTDWSFPALDTLVENGGVLHLFGGADFPADPFAVTDGDFLNRGELFLLSGSVLKVGGAFRQSGDAARTLLDGGTITSATNDFQIIGGRVTADASAGFLNRVGSSFLAGTTIRIESPLIGTDEIDPFTNETVFVQYPVSVNLGSGVSITTLGNGVDLTLHGSAIAFPALQDNLEVNEGRLTVSGDGIDNAGLLRVAPFSGDTFINRGELNLLGGSSELQTAGYRQESPGSLTRLGAGATFVVSGKVVIANGTFVLEIATRPAESLFGQIKASEVDFGGRLVIDITGSLAATMPDIGDTWEIISRNQSANILGVSSEAIAYTLEGAPLPVDWLPPGSHFELVSFETAFGPRGLGLRVTPDSGFVSYDNWAAANGLDRALATTDPLRDANNDGVINALEFLFGPNEGDGSFPGQQQQRLFNENAETFFELRYMRPVGVDAVYTPYYSQDLENWFPAAMVVKGIAAAESGLDLEWVTLQSTFAVPEGSIFFRVRGELNPDTIDLGLLPEKPINWSSGLDSFNGVLRFNLGVEVAYTVEPGKVLYFSVRGSTSDSIYGGTAANGVDRNFIYQARSSLGVAAVHAGLLDNQEQGILKVTFIAPQTTDFLRSRQFYGTSGDSVTSQFAAPIGGDPYAYRIELYSRDGE